MTDDSMTLINSQNNLNFGIWNSDVQNSACGQSFLWRRFPTGYIQPLLYLQDLICRLDDGIRIKRDAVDATSDQELSKLWIVTRSLSADTDLPPIPFDPLNHPLDHPLYRRIPLIEDMGDFLRITIQAQHQLGQVIGANGKSIENLAEFIGHDHIAGDFAHHIDFKPIQPLDKAMLPHLRHD